MFLDNRDMIPRWRDARTTAASGEFNSLSNRGEVTSGGDRYFSAKLAAWNEQRDVVNAVEVVSAGIVLGRAAEAIDAARFLLRQPLDLAPSVHSMAQKLISRNAPQRAAGLENENLDTIEYDSRGQVRALRRRLSSAPRNPLAWTDLAREYAVLGEADKSRHAMDVAINLAPTNRFVLRSAARLLVHQKRPDQAHRLLQGKAITRHDPWLLCVEIAVSSLVGKTSRLIREGRQIIDQATYASRHTAELASTLGTLELGAGDNRRARRFFLESLRQPTENVVAQAEWASRQMSGIEFDQGYLEVARSYEARAFEQCKEGKWKEAVESCECWWVDEPFSRRPASFGSFLAQTTHEDFAKSEGLARAALKANPEESALLNNLAVVLALRGKLAEAQIVFGQINSHGVDNEERIILTATEGMLLFRGGQREKGRYRYLQASEQATRAKDGRLAILALLYLAREELVAGTAVPGNIAGTLEKAARFPNPIIQAMAAMIQSTYILGRPAAVPRLVQYVQVPPKVALPIRKRH